MAVLILPFVLAALPCAATENALPFIAQYEGKKKIFLFTATAKAQLELHRSGQYLKYDMRSTVTWSILKRKFYDCSIIRLDGDKMLPLEYLHIDDSNREFNVRSRFDWDNGKAETTLGDASSPKIVDLTWPTWDPMSFQLALLTLAPARAPGSSESHHVLERGTLKQHSVHFNGAVAITSKLGNLNAYEVITKKTKGGAALWLAPDLSWVPARITIEDVTIDLIAAPTIKNVAEDADGLAPQCE